MDYVDGVEQRGLGWGAAWFNDSLLAAFEALGALRVGQIDLTIDQRKDCASIFVHGQVKLRASNRAGSDRRAKLNFRRFLPAEEVSRTGFEVGLRFAAGFLRRLDFDAGQLIDAQHAQVRPAESRAASRAGAQPISGVQDLIGLG